MAPRPRIELRKLLFVLPNLFTVSSIFCGFYAITLCVGEASGEQLYRAALLIFFATFFDAFDGRVARLTRTQSEFGMHLDSLADVVSFGVAPGLLAYKWGLAPLGTTGVLLAFIFPACGALRLARFNVLASREGPHHAPSAFFVGLPIPVAAAMLISLVIAHHKHFGRAVIHHYWVGLLVVGLGLLMVSNVRFRTFKDVGFSRKSALVFLLILAAGVMVATRARASFALVGYVGAYVVLGLVEELYRQSKALRRRGEDESAEEDEEDLLPAEEDEEVYS
ncbi:MAG: CDP-diacylglycerol--serine O-phosphatidyltransferase [Deltaproteobacteria bacterium]|nr:CDP-diacylglycerol--serine O-phosphatidyltransferase [Deltaproteobacteria bacterium]